MYSTRMQVKGLVVGARVEGGVGWESRAGGRDRMVW